MITWPSSSILVWAFTPYAECKINVTLKICPSIHSAHYKYDLEHITLYTVHVILKICPSIHSAHYKYDLEHITLYTVHVILKICPRIHSAHYKYDLEHITLYTVHVILKICPRIHSAHCKYDLEHITLYMWHWKYVLLHTMQTVESDLESMTLNTLCICGKECMNLYTTYLVKFNVT